MSNALAIIKSAIAGRADSLAVVTGVNEGTVVLATNKGRAEAQTALKLAIGDNVYLNNGVVSLAPKATIVEPV